MAEDRADTGVHTGDQSLCFAKGIGEDDCGNISVTAVNPPLIDVVENGLLVRPAIDWQAKGGFSNEGVTAYGFEGRAGRVRLGLVIAADDPDFPAKLDAYLGGRFSLLFSSNWVPILNLLLGPAVTKCTFLFPGIT